MNGKYEVKCEFGESFSSLQVEYTFWLLLQKFVDVKNHAMNVNFILEKNLSETLHFCPVWNTQH